MNDPSAPIAVAIAIPLEPWMLARIRAVDDRLEVRCAPDQPLFDDTQIAFGVPEDFPDGLAGLVQRYPRLRCAIDRAPRPSRCEIWTRSPTRPMPMPGRWRSFTTAGILAFAEHLPILLADTQSGRWHPRPMTGLTGSSCWLEGWGGWEPKSRVSTTHSVCR